MGRAGHLVVCPPPPSYMFPVVFSSCLPVSLGVLSSIWLFRKLHARESIDLVYIDLAPPSPGTPEPFFLFRETNLRELEATSTNMATVSIPAKQNASRAPG
jgi:hypothetical protein